MLDLKSAGALVAGSDKPKEVRKMKVKCVLRFWAGGKLVDKGDVVEVDEALAREVIGSGKAVEEAPKPEAPKSKAKE